MKAIAPLAVNAEAISRLVQADPEERKSEDMQIALSTALGSAMFSTSDVDSSLSSYSKLIDDLVVKLKTADVVSEDDLVQYHTQARDLAATAAAGQEQRLKRMIEIEVSGRQIQLEV